jgi:hypothetical protein
MRSLMPTAMGCLAGGKNNYHLSDSNPLDAASDLDGDGLTALQEYNAGNNSNRSESLGY